MFETAPKTHYAVLNVSPDAPQEVIDAAYKILCKKYHPDLNHNAPSAVKRMAEINASYDVLSNYGKRYQYDMQLLREAVPKKPNPQATQKPAAKPAPAASAWQRRSLRRTIWGGKGDSTRRTLLIGGFFLLLYATNTTHGLFRALPFGWPFAGHTPQDIASSYERPATAPNGAVWPKAAGYVPGYKIENERGDSAIVVDNSKNNADVFVKLLAVDKDSENPVRVVFVPKGNAFTLDHIEDARYVLQYMDLDSGSLFRIAPFDLKEKITPTGAQPGRLRMTLHKVLYTVSVNEF